ncbi:hypothetical protein PCANC_22283 [Puccinia coronata f. sp. avenae]|uniref:Uncharacterized protein n=1 Tax=Puccinia coronata f. sp. avenae TaxID=200324 RepID=A0A2N5UTM5_9BASI|nr:hypothetical protein PCANC_22283 [Puccinia coronata f. sp. avenae]
MAGVDLWWAKLPKVAAEGGIGPPPPSLAASVAAPLEDNYTLRAAKVRSRRANPARPPPHAARRPHAYKWREDSRLGVRPRRTGVLAMHACPEGVQALHALRTGVQGRHACPARLT